MVYKSKEVERLNPDSGARKMMSGWRVYAALGTAALGAILSSGCGYDNGATRRAPENITYLKGDDLPDPVGSLDEAIGQAAVECLEKAGKQYKK